MNDKILGCLLLLVVLAIFTIIIIKIFGLDTGNNFNVPVDQFKK